MTHQSSTISNSRSGFATLPVVLVITLLLQIIGVTLLLLSRFSIQRSQQFSYSQQALFAAEGALNDWILQFKYDPSWLSQNSYSDTITVGDVLVKRSFIYNAMADTYHVEVQSDFKGAKRKLVADYVIQDEHASEENTVPLDIIFVTDRSGSMSSTLAKLKDAMISLISSSYLKPQDQISLVSYSDYATLDWHLTTDRQAIIDKINTYNASGTTYVSDGLALAKQELDLDVTTETTKVVIVFSDGVSNKGKSGTGVFGCPYDACFDPASPDNYEPDGGGNACTEDAILVARSLQDLGYDVYSIFYVGHPNAPTCGDAHLTTELGRRTMRALVENSSHYFETDNKQELENIFKEIGRNIEESRQRKVQYKEVEPDAN